MGARAGRGGGRRGSCVFIVALGALTQLASCGGPPTQPGPPPVESGGPAPASEPVGYQPRDAFGTADAALWFPAGAFEAATYRSAAKAAAGDPVALFDFALVGSAARLTPEAAANLRGHFLAFVEKVRPEVEAEADPWQRGFKLHRAMHRELLAGGSGELGNYDWNQSALAPIFTTRKYNCISSALLFGLAARLMGLDAEGVVLKTHAFIQLRLPNGRLIEVETTNPTGYDWVHDEKFYAKDAAGWSAARRLPPTTMADYQARRIVTLPELVAGNMRNQHTRAAGVSLSDRDRLTEFSSALVPGDAALARWRLAAYHGEANDLSLHAREDEIVRLAARIGPVVDDIAARHGADPDVAGTLRWFRAETIRAYGRLGRADEAVAEWRRSAALYVSTATPPDPDIAGSRTRAFSAFAELTRPDIDGKRFERAESVFAQVAADCTSFAWCQNNRFVNLLNWGNEAYNAKDFGRALERYALARSQAASEQDVASVRQNVENAYLCMSDAHAAEGNWPKAVEVLDTCVAADPGHAACVAAAARLRAEHRM